MTIDPVLATGAQAGMAIVVLLGAAAKMRRPAAFRDALGGYRLLPDALTAPAAFALPLAEAFGAAALLFPDTRTIGAGVLVALLLAALAATAFAEPAARAVVWFDYLTLFFAVLLIVCTLLTADALLANVPRLSHLRNS
ncbi:methylamine utilization protein MauE [Burkholderia stagnalis]|uniref:MauE/DoxX family redox-associated membrane protein n=1 Tax=Burkholderia stagnalis TaxID=1503054 RepID=UPI000F56F2B8|nr:MauE/DoxX family redox-associated membrane protein [Burkholderia stagnalis]RQQ04951.1 methylamine utilization protein MauE [Burkholderia stagnalis]RQQ13935.1 methylamine utilization protein MauE [Burkholderia stagnalis]RQQ25114.1 methylamine utilization protein MauE [Burkholderia stagnalis]RQQ27611.1 methylamine utilization protein MauE [Burkholderia stagnalis]RQQ32636.1 methylamine utilization protein MauE [Burkholderia stagnalis]